MFRSDEQRRFHQFVRKHIEVLDGPLLLEGGTGLGKTRAYLAALAATELSVAIVFPTHQLIDQLLQSEDLKAVELEVTAYRRADLFESRADYLAYREEAMAGRVMLCTAASVIIDQRLKGNYNGAILRDYILFDEADQLPAAAALQRDLTITQYELNEAKVRLGDIKGTLDALVAKKGLDPEVRARAMLISEALAEPAWYQQVGKDDEGGIILRHQLPGRLLSRLSNEASVAFISATLQVAHSFDDFKRGMGIREESRLSTTVEPERHGEISIYTELDEDIADLVQNAAKPCLIATTSHEDSAAIGRQLPHSVVRLREEHTSDAALRVPEFGVLIAANAWAGLDTPIRWASIIIPKVPFERPTVIDDKIESSYIDSRNVAIRRMRQVVGRGLRTPDAVCDIYILDRRYKKLGDFLPDRFKESWSEGKRELALVWEQKRNRRLRQKVLERFGLNCAACGFVAPNPNLIDVHHLHPIAEGERETTLDDLVPLCPTCHRWVHTRNPPMKIEELRNIRKPRCD